VSRRFTIGFKPGVLRESREKAGLRLDDLERLSGIARGELRLYEGGRAPSPDRLAVLARILGIDPLDFVDRGAVGHGLRGLRIASGIRLGELQLRLGLSGQQLTYLETGRRRSLPGGLAESLAAAFGVPVREVRAAFAWDVAQHEAAAGTGGDEAAARVEAARRGSAGVRRPRLPADRQAFSGEALRRRREERGLSIADLRRLSGISTQDLTAYESGQVPGPGRLVRLGQAFGVSPLELLDRDVIGYGLRALRTAAGLQRADAAIGADLTTIQLQKLEEGITRRLAPGLAERLASALGTSPAAVLAAHQWDLANFDAMGNAGRPAPH
jgi:transcriptional regulator with XRE-family HTH domain